MNWLDLIAPLAAVNRSLEGNPEIRDIVSDPCHARPGSVFVALATSVDVIQHQVTQAVHAGACAIVSSHSLPGFAVPWVQVDDTGTALGELAKRLWDVKMYSKRSIAVTGTSKDIASRLIGKLLEQCPSQGPVLVASAEATNVCTSADIFRRMARSTPSPGALVMEVTSTMLAAGLMSGLSFDVAVFTDTVQDHRDTHRTASDSYRAQKLLFSRHLRSKGKAVVNIDDTWGQRLVSEVGDRTVVTFGTSHHARVRIVNWRCTWDGTAVDLIVGGEIVQLTSKLPGEAHVSVIASLAATALSLSIDWARVQAVLDAMAGCRETLDLAVDFRVIVDAAQTPDALERVLRSVGELTPGRVLCLFDAGGDHDSSHRNAMAHALARGCDEAIVTACVASGDDPLPSINGFVEHLPLDFPNWAIPDKRVAAVKALTMARFGDCVVITGNGYASHREAILEAYRHVEEQRAHA